jgi:hypothetical protein
LVSSRRGRRRGRQRWRRPHTAHAGRRWGSENHNWCGRSVGAGRSPPGRGRPGRGGLRPGNG